MKWSPLFFLMFLVSCEEKIPEYKKKVERQTQPQVLEERKNNVKAIVHLDPRVKINTETEEIEITGQSGEMCGISFKEGQVLRYQLINDSELEIQMESETLKLHRIHLSEANGLYGDWQTQISVDTVTERERIVTFIIRDQEVMEVDVYCEHSF